jgi:hypothetical protein
MTVETEHIFAKEIKAGIQLAICRRFRYFGSGCEVVMQKYRMLRLGGHAV